MKNLYKRSLIKSLTFLLLISFTSSDLLAQLSTLNDYATPNLIEESVVTTKKRRRGFRGIEAKIFCQSAMSYLKLDELNESTIVYKPGLSFMLLKNSRRGNVEALFIGADLYVNVDMKNYYEASIQSNIYSGLKVVDNLMLCAGVTIEMVSDYSENNIIPGAHMALNYFMADDISLAFELDYHGRERMRSYESTYSFSSSNNNSGIQYQLIPSIKMRAPLSLLLQSANINIVL